MGDLINRAFHIGRNNYDRVVHLNFVFLLTYPLEELFRLTGAVRGWLLLSAGYDHSWPQWAMGHHRIIMGARVVHPQLGIIYLGSQGDVWDAQKDMTAALYGSLLCVGLLLGGGLC
jgi:putative membrane protein